MSHSLHPACHHAQLQDGWGFNKPPIPFNNKQQWQQPSATLCIVTASYDCSRMALYFAITSSQYYQIWIGVYAILTMTNATDGIRHWAQPANVASTNYFTIMEIAWIACCSSNTEVCIEVIIITWTRLNVAFLSGRCRKQFH